MYGYHFDSNLFIDLMGNYSLPPNCLYQRIVELETKTCNLYLLCNNFKVTYKSVRLGVMIEYFIKVILIVHVNL